LAVYLNRRFALRVGMTGFCANVLVIAGGAWLHDMDMALYSLIFLFTCGRVTDQIVSGFNARKSVIVISERSEAIARVIMERMGRGVTYLDGQGAYTGRQKKVILTITTRTDLPKLKAEVLFHDPDAFVIINDTMEVAGKSGRGLERYSCMATESSQPVGGKILDIT
jgi:uncharacterized membrane-anchored protein YitT (DUF2179 family)